MVAEPSNKQDSLDMKTQRNLKVLFGLMALGGKSDREIAKNLGINNTTLSRGRKKLEKEGYIKEYTIIPDLHKIGLEVIVVSFSSTSDSVTKEQLKDASQLVQKHTEILCHFEDLGPTGTNWVTVSVHKNYNDFVECSEKVQKELLSLHPLPRMDIRIFMFRTSNLFPKPFSLRNLEQLFQPIKTSSLNKNKTDNKELMAESLSKQDTFDMKTQRNLKVLFGLMALCGKSDREIARNLGINNTTLSRKRRALEKDGYIKEYTIIPDFHKMGLEFLLFTYSSTTDLVTPGQSKKFYEQMNKYPNVLCVLEDQRPTGTNWVMISIHKNYETFSELCIEAEKDFLSLQPMPHAETRSFMFRTSNLFPKPFSLRNLEQLFQPIKTSSLNKNKKYNKAPITN